MQLIELGACHSAIRATALQPLAALLVLAVDRRAGDVLRLLVIANLLGQEARPAINASRCLRTAALLTRASAALATNRRDHFHNVQAVRCLCCTRARWVQRVVNFASVPTGCTARPRQQPCHVAEGSGSKACRPLYGGQPRWRDSSHWSRLPHLPLNVHHRIAYAALAVEDGYVRVWARLRAMSLLCRDAVRCAIVRADSTPQAGHMLGCMHVSFTTQSSLRQIPPQWRCWGCAAAAPHGYRGNH